MFGKSLWIKGLNAFLGNLIQRFGVTEESSGFWLSDYLSGCSHRIYEAGLPGFLKSIPTFKALATLIYREFRVPIIGLRTIEETAVLYPVDKTPADVSFQSIIILSNSKDVALKIEKLTPSVLIRHTDLFSNGEGQEGTQGPNSAMAGLLSTIEGKLPFRSMSIAFVDDPRSSRSARGVRSSARQNSRGSIPSTGRQSSKSDKITPLQSDDDYGDATSVRENGASHPPKIRIQEKRGSVTHFSALLERGGSVAEDDESLHTDRGSSEQPGESDLVRKKVKSPSAVALSPTKLTKKTSSPYMPPLSPRSLPGSARGGTPRAKGIERVYIAESPPVDTSESNPTTTETLSPRSSRENISAKKSTTSSESGAIDSPSAGSVIYHSNPHENGEKSVQREPSSGHLDSSEQLEEADEFIVEAPVIRRKSSGGQDPRLRRVSMLRSFHRAPPPHGLENHFVVCGTPSNYADFLANLSDLGESLSAVVFVTPRELTDKEFHAYSLHKELYFVRGSPVSMQVFHEARMLYARSILIMSYCAAENVEGKEHEAEQMDENMADVDAITTHRFISEACQNVAQRSRGSVMPKTPSPFIVAEMIRPSNVKFLIDRAGSLYDEKALENEFRKHELLKDTKCIDECFFSPIYASGHIYFSNAMDALMGSCSQNPLLVDMITQLIISGNMSMNLPDHDARSKHRLSQIPAPVQYHSRPYALMVEKMLQEEVR